MKYVGLVPLPHILKTPSIFLQDQSQLVTTSLDQWCSRHHSFAIGHLTCHSHIFQPIQAHSLGGLPLHPTSALVHSRANTLPFQMQSSALCCFFVSSSERKALVEESSCFLAPLTFERKDIGYRIFGGKKIIVPDISLSK